MSICSKCGLPTEICVCEQIALEQQVVEIYIERRKYGKLVTIIHGINSSDINIDDIAKKLKTKCASGGTVKDDRIELQGNHEKKVREALTEMGFRIK
jgi:translation initiation factor 1